MAEKESTSCCILNAATKLFSRKGMGGTTTREIAGLAGVNIAALHYHWGGKEDLLKAVYQKVIEEVGLLAAQLFYPSETGLRETFKNYFGRLHDFFLANPEYPRVLLYGDLEDPSFLEELRQQYVIPLIRQVSENLKRLMREQKIRKIDPEATLITLYGALLHPFVNGSTQEAMMGHPMTDKKVAKRFKEQFIDTVLVVFGLQSEK